MSSQRPNNYHLPPPYSLKREELTARFVPQHLFGETQAKKLGTGIVELQTAQSMEDKGNKLLDPRFAGSKTMVDAN